MQQGQTHIESLGAQRHPREGGRNEHSYVHEAGTQSPHRRMASIDEFGMLDVSQFNSTNQYNERLSLFYIFRVRIFFILSIYM